MDAQTWTFPRRRSVCSGDHRPASSRAAAPERGTRSLLSLCLTPPASILPSPSCSSPPRPLQCVHTFLALVFRSRCATARLSAPYPVFQSSSNGSSFLSIPILIIVIPTTSVSCPRWQSPRMESLVRSRWTTPRKRRRASPLAALPDI